TWRCSANATTPSRRTTASPTPCSPPAPSCGSHPTAYASTATPTAPPTSTACLRPRTSTVPPPTRQPPQRSYARSETLPRARSATHPNPDHPAPHPDTTESGSQACALPNQRGASSRRGRPRCARTGRGHATDRIAHPRRPPPARQTPHSPPAGTPPQPPRRAPSLRPSAPVRQVGAGGLVERDGVGPVQPAGGAPGVPPRAGRVREEVHAVGHPRHRDRREERHRRHRLAELHPAPPQRRQRPRPQHHQHPLVADAVRDQVQLPAVPRPDLARRRRQHHRPRRLRVPRHVLLPLVVAEARPRRTDRRQRRAR